VKAVLAGDYVLSVASIALAKIGNNEVVRVLSQVLEDLVAGMYLSCVLCKLQLMTRTAQVLFLSVSESVQKNSAEGFLL